LPDDPEVFLSVVGLRGPDAAHIIRDSLTASVDFKAFSAEWDKNIGIKLRQAIPVKQGAMQLLKILTAKGYPTVVATSTPTETARLHLRKVDLLPYLGGVVGGDLVVKGKPDPEIYHKAAAHLELDASDCFAFEDSEPGATAAMASGATTIQVPDLIPASATFAKRGHVIASTLLEGAIAVGLISSVDV
jgi:HAD superfamily hydrolase (TIGR01509 family)